MWGVQKNQPVTWGKKKLLKEASPAGFFQPAAHLVASKPPGKLQDNTTLMSTGGSAPARQEHISRFSNDHIGPITILLL